MKLMKKVMKAMTRTVASLATHARADAAPEPTSRTARPGPRARGPVWSVAAAVLVSLVVPLAAFAPAAQAEVLISNIDKSDDGDLTVGTTGTSKWAQALGFRTGASAAGYRLTSVRAKFNSASSSSGVRVRIFSASGNNPGSSEYILTNPSSLGGGSKTFTAPEDAELDPSTHYFVVFDSTNTSSYTIDITDSDALTGTPATGWTLNNSRHRKVGSGAWTTQDAKPLIEINGDTIGVNATGQPEITGVPQVGETLTATIGTITDEDGLPTWPSGFTFQWVRVDGSTETNIGTNSATYSPVAGDVGKTIKLTVTFTDDDGNSEGPLESDETAEVVAALGACPSNAEWCTVLTVGESSNQLVAKFGFEAGSYGSMDDDTIEYDGVTYTIEQLVLRDDILSSTHTFLLDFDTNVPEPTVVSLNGAEFTVDAVSQQP